MVRFYGKMRLYIQVLLCFVAFMLLFCTVFAFVYFKTTDQLKTSAINETLNTMQRGARDVNETFFNLYAAFDVLLSLDEFNSLARIGMSGLDPPGYSQMIQIRKRMEEMCALDDTITDIMLFFDAEKSFVISPLYILHDFQSSYNSGQILCGDLDYDEFVTLIRQYSNNYVSLSTFTPAYPFTCQLSAQSNTPQGDMIMFIYRLNITYGKYDIYGILFLDAAAIGDKLTAGEADFFAIGSGGEVLYTNDPSIPLSGMDGDTQYLNEIKATLVSTVSPNILVTYYTAVRDETIVGQISRFSLFLYILMGVFVILSVTVLILLVVYFVKPIQNLFNRFYETPAARPEVRGNMIRHIAREIDAISNENTLINSRLSRWTPIFKTNLVGRLLKGEYLRSEEKELIRSLMGADSGNSAWQAAVIGRIIDARTPAGDGEIAQIGKIIWQHLPNAIVYVMRSNALAVLADLGSPDNLKMQAQRNVFEKACGRALEELNETERIYAMGIGNPYDTIFDLHCSFREAERAFREVELWRNPDFLQYRSIREYTFEYTVPYGDIEKLYEYLVDGDAGQAYALLVSMAERNIGDQDRNRQYYYSLKQFYNEVLGVLMRIAAHRDLSPVLGSIMDCPDDLCPDAMLELFRQAFDFIAETFRNEVHTPIRDLYMSMLKFIDDRYDDRDLSLKMLSREFSLTEPYLSLCFKNEAGVNFSNYLENLRLTRAEKNLLETNMSIKKIAKSVGYSTSNTFYKAFKRKHGVTPSVWAAQHRSMGIES